jgi:hypothetical protein
LRCPLIPAESDKPAETTPRIATSEPDLAAIGASAQRKAAWRLLPIISIGYGLAYMDRINISFASLRMNSDLHFSATVYGLGAGLFFIGYALVRGPVKPTAFALRAQALARAHHADVGVTRCVHDVRAHAARVL